MVFIPFDLPVVVEGFGGELTKWWLDVEQRLLCDFMIDRMFCMLAPSECDLLVD